MAKVHYRHGGRVLCGLRSGGRHRSVQITSTRTAADVTCKVCQVCLRASFYYEGFALFDQGNAIVFPSTRGERSAVQEYALKTYGGRWFERYRVEPVLMELR
jgi:hypothetical protein